jgi:hypothetical protein
VYSWIFCRCSAGNVTLLTVMDAADALGSTLGEQPAANSIVVNAMAALVSALGNLRRRGDDGIP